MVIDVRIKYGSNFERTPNSIKTALDKTFPSDVFTVTPLPQVSEDYKQTLRDIENILSKSITSYIPTLTVFELEGIVSGAKCIVQKALNDLNSQRINGEKDGLVNIIAPKSIHDKPAPQLPEKLQYMVDTNTGRKCFPPDEFKVTDTINAIIIYLQQKEGEGR